MKKLINAVISCMVSFAVLLSLGCLGIDATAIEIGYSLYTDISATIDGVTIESHNIGGNTVICAEELLEFGFTVIWDGNNRSLNISEGKRKITADEASIPIVDSKMLGTKKDVIYSTDIITKCGNEYVLSYNIGGKTLIPFDCLSNFGEITWNAAKREISLRRFSLEADGRSIAMSSENIDDSTEYSYSFGKRWASQQNSLIFEKYGYVKTVDFDKTNNLLVQNVYESNCEENIGSASLKLDYPLFGGCFKGKDYLYAVCGQSNKEEDDGKTVIQILKLSDDLTVVGKLNITGGNAYTTIPFDCGSSGICESQDGSELIVHTSRKRYTTEDGLNHESQLTLIINTADMTLKNKIKEFQANHVSHSFNQFVRYDKSNHVLVDHGDAYPRSIVINVFKDGRYTATDLLKIPGSIGANCTGVTVGGFEISDTSYITAFNKVDFDKIDTFDNYNIRGKNFLLDERDAMLAVLRKGSSKPSLVRLSYCIDEGRSAGTPFLVKINGNKFAVLWEEYVYTKNDANDKYYARIFDRTICAFTDGSGNVTDTYILPNTTRLSYNCTPCVIGDSIIWYSNIGKSKQFFKADIH